MLYRETSRDAWDGFQPVSGKLDNQILAALQHAGKATCQEIERAIARDHQAVSGNLRHLVERKFVRASGEFGRTASGRRAILWELVPAQAEAA
jgi:hypothetical protein